MNKTCVQFVYDDDDDSCLKVVVYGAMSQQDALDAFRAVVKMCKSKEVTGEAKIASCEYDVYELSVGV